MRMPRASSQSPTRRHRHGKVNMKGPQPKAVINKRRRSRRRRSSSSSRHKAKGAKLGGTMSKRLREVMIPKKVMATRHKDSMKFKDLKQVKTAKEKKGAVNAEKFKDVKILTKLQKPDVSRLCALIRGVYERKNPSKLKELDVLLEKYAGAEDEVYLHVCRKYGETPQREAVSQYKSKESRAKQDGAQAQATPRKVAAKGVARKTSVSKPPLLSLPSAQEHASILEVLVDTAPPPSPEGGWPFLGEDAPSASEEKDTSSDSPEHNDNRRKGVLPSGGDSSSMCSTNVANPFPPFLRHERPPGCWESPIGLQGSISRAQGHLGGQFLPKPMPLTPWLPNMYTPGPSSQQQHSRLPCAPRDAASGTTTSISSKDDDAKDIYADFLQSPEIATADVSGSQQGHASNLDLANFVGDWNDSLGHNVQVTWSHDGNRDEKLDVSLTRSKGDHEVIRINVKHIGGKRFTCGHYDLDTDKSHVDRMVWLDRRNRGRMSVWERQLTASVP